MTSTTSTAAGAGFERLETKRIETALSQVFLRGQRAWRIRRAPNESLDERRRRALEELEIGRRMCPRVYHRIVPVSVDRSGQPRFGDDGEVQDWAIEMRRLPDERRADWLVRDGEQAERLAERMAEHLATVHAMAPRTASIARWGFPVQLTANLCWRNGDAADSAPVILGAARAQQLHARQVSLVACAATRLRRRAQEGFVRAVHGNLRLEHVYLDGDGEVALTGWTAVKRLRYADVAADVAELAQDIALHGAPTLAERFVAAYAQAAEDHEVYALLELYASQRASLRGYRLAAVEGGRTAARHWFETAMTLPHSHELPPSALVVGGPHPGDRWRVAQRLAEQWCAPLVSIRRAAGRITPTQRVSMRPAEIELRAYEELLSRAHTVLEGGRPVVVEGCFGTRGMRLAARLRLSPFPFVFVECRHSPTREAVSARVPWHDRWEAPGKELRDAQHVVIGGLA